MLKLGKLPARPDAVRLKFATYLTGALPTPPTSFGHDNLVKTYPMLGNDQYGDCIAPSTRVLTAALEWVPAGSVQVGDKLLGFDEERLNGPNGGRRFAECVVEKSDIVQRPCYELKFSDGTTVISSEGHRWLVKSTIQGDLGCQRWMRTEDLRVGPTRQSKVIKPLDVWGAEHSWSAGYLAAAFDGEGNLEYANSTQYGQTFTRVNFNQTDNEMLYQVELALKELGFDSTNYRHQRGRTMSPRMDGSPRKDLTRISIGGRADFLRFMGSVRPRRLLAKMNGNYGRIPGRSVALISKVFIGEHDVVMLDTSSRTYFANGLASHNCVWAGAGHETQIWTAEAGSPVTITENNALAAYSAVTGFNRNDPSTDQGTDMQAAASYRRKTGILDSHGKRHKVGAYVALTPGDVHQLYTATWLFGAVGVGIEFPAFAMDDFNARKPWDVQKTNAKIEGGHYIPAVGHHSGFINVVTWGREIGMTEAFYKKYCDEAIAYLSPEMLKGGESLEGFNLAQLTDDLKQVTAA
jgi:LAGLIDADG-like domain